MLDAERISPNPTFHLTFGQFRARGENETESSRPSSYRNPRIAAAFKEHGKEKEQCPPQEGE
jgi:hypothetical protein